MPGALPAAGEGVVLAAGLVRATAAVCAGAAVFTVILVRLSPRGAAREIWCGIRRLRPPAARTGNKPPAAAAESPGRLRLFALPSGGCTVLHDERARRLQHAAVTLALVRLMGLRVTAAETRVLAQFSSVPWILESLHTAAGHPRREYLQFVLPAVVQGLALHLSVIRAPVAPVSPVPHRPRRLYPRYLVRHGIQIRTAAVRRTLNLRRRSATVAADLRIFHLYLEVVPMVHRLAGRPALAGKTLKLCGGTVSRLQDRLHRYHPHTPQGGPPWQDGKTEMKWQR